MIIKQAKILKKKFNFSITSELEIIKNKNNLKGINLIDVNFNQASGFSKITSKSKYFNDDVVGETITNYELNMWHVDQNISYYFDKYRARLTGGYTYHNVAHETETNSAPRSN